MSEIPVQSQLTPLVNTVARIIAIMNNKGGAGKTSTITNLAMSLAHAGRRVLLIDGDQQANSTEVMANGKKYYAQYGHTICDLYNNPRFSIFDAIIPAVSGEEVIDNLYIIPSDPSFERVMENCLTRHHREKILSRHLQSVMDKFDYILIDCPPSLGLITLNALNCCDTLLIPIQCEYYALEGLSQLMGTVRQVKRLYNPQIEIEGVLLTMFDGRLNLTLQVVEEVKKFFPKKVYRTVIPRNVRLSEAPSFGQPVLYYDRTSRGSKAYEDLADEFLENNQ